MPQLLTLSRAARLVGVTRSALQKRIREGELATFEGQVSVADLLRVYPDTQMNDTTMLERVERIKADAVHDLNSEPLALPSPQVLITRLAALSRELIKTKTEFNRYTELLETLLHKLVEVERFNDEQWRTQIQTLREWLAKEIDNPALAAAEREVELLAKDAFLRVMAAHVKLLPSGHEFWVEGSESILNAALRSGLALNYGCTNGNCGLCKGRVIAGEVLKTRHHDYALSEVERESGYRLMCCHTAVTDVVLEAMEAHTIADIPLQKTEAKIKKLECVADKLVLLQAQTPRTKTLRFFAGQHVILTLPGNISKTCFIASCPCDGRNLAFHIYKIPGDIFTEMLCSNEHQMLTIEGPKGDFTLVEESSRPLLLLAESFGFAPIKGLIEHAIALDNAESFHLYWLSSDKVGGHYQSNLCRSWADALDHFHYTLLTVEEDIQRAPALAQIFENLPQLANFEIYAAGSQAFGTAVETLLRRYMFPEAQFHFGSFESLSRP